MARKKTRIVALLKSAQKTLAQEILASTMQKLPRRTTMGEVVTSVEAAGFGRDFNAMSLAEFVSALTGEGSAKAARGGKSGATRGKKATRRRAAKVNTRTAQGRAAMDTAIGQFLASAAGPARAEAVRAAVGGTPAQIRQSMSRLMSEKKVTKSGAKRGTLYALRGKAGTPAKASASPRKRKKSARSQKAGA